MCMGFMHLGKFLSICNWNVGTSQPPLCTEILLQMRFVLNTQIFQDLSSKGQVQVLCTEILEAETFTLY